MQWHDKFQPGVFLSGKQELAPPVRYQAELGNENQNKNQNHISRRLGKGGFLPCPTLSTCWVRCILVNPPAGFCKQELALPFSLPSGAW